tara:strand:- start:80 stop:307 length:228 start_codon:yes stop_codon:yes gene_type:complete
VSYGIHQALVYSSILDVPSAFSSNGDAFHSDNGFPEPDEDIETELALDHFPSPDVLEPISGVSERGQVSLLYKIL